MHESHASPESRLRRALFSEGKGCGVDIEERGGGERKTRRVGER